MLTLAARALRRRTGSLAGTFVALLFSAAVVSACGILLESGLRTTQAPQRYAAADVVVAGRRQADVPIETLNGTRRMDRKPLTERTAIAPGIAARLARVEGVRSLTPDRSLPAEVTTPATGPVTGRNRLPPTAHTWSSTRLGDLRVVAGRPPATPREVALDRSSARRAGIRLGSRVTVLTATGAQDETVTALVARSDGGDLREAAVFYPDRHLPTGPSVRTRAIGVLADPGTDISALAARMTDVLGRDPHLEVYTGQARARAEFADLTVSASALVTLAASVGGNAVVVSLFVVCATLALHVSHRRREMALLRAVGATPRQIRRMIRAEALLIAVPAGLLGWLLGVAAVRWMRGPLADHHVIPADFTPYTGPLPGAAALSVTVLSAVVAGVAASRRATRIAPTQALGEAAVPPRALGRGRAITGTVLALASLGVFLTGLRSGGDFATLVGLANSLVLLLVVTAAVLGPVLARAAVRILGPLLGVAGPTGRLAAVNTWVDARALAAAVTPLVLAVSFTSTVVFAQTTGLARAQQQMRDGLRADQVVTSAVGIPPVLLRQIRENPHVKAATPVTRSKVVIVGRALGEEKAADLSAQGVDPAHLADTLDLAVTRGSIARLTARTVALSTSAASWLGLGVGDRARLYLGDGTPLSATVIATYERGMGFADVTLAHDLLPAHTTGGLPGSVLVRTRDDQPAADHELTRTLRRHPGVALQNRLTTDTQLRRQATDAWTTYLIVGLVIALVGVAVVTTQAMATAARRREFTLLRLTGAQNRQVMRMVAFESLSVVVAGLAVGSALSVPSLMLVARALGDSWWPVVPVPVYLLIAGTVAFLTAAGALVPARLHLLRRPRVAGDAHG
ncbi:FtsX-like permease family protein [Streptomyces sp. NRRL WC-3725]|uniref:FtsX-like permease family protein n=1 Tax=Streptomyces sp. NRRL WC-3725 TaxID=1463933 RepID=UPI0006899E4E|nr:FtsX-like permease family protein [Streptomyces sp. NRRL WC-3725]